MFNMFNKNYSANPSSYDNLKIEENCATDCCKMNSNRILCQFKDESDKLLGGPIDLPLDIDKNDLEKLCQALLADVNRILRVLLEFIGLQENSYDNVVKCLDESLCSLRRVSL